MNRVAYYKKGLNDMLNNHKRVDIDKTNEMRTREISSMINEGGLGADKYYNIHKEAQSKTMPTNLTESLNQLIASLGLFYFRLHQYHWHVKGDQFFTLHAKFEELYNDTTQYLDAFAERLIAKDERPLSTLGEFLEHSTISEKVYDQNIQAKEMVRNVVADYSEISKVVESGIALAAEDKDAVTEDMLIGYKEYIDKTIWMLKSFIED